MQDLALAGVSGVPQVLGFGQLPGGGGYVATTPFGRHISPRDDPRVIARVMKELAQTLKQMAVSGFLHNDISPG